MRSKTNDSHSSAAIKMGCCPSGPVLPPDAPEEEKTITKRELELGYSAQTPEKFMSALLANTDGGKTTVNQFNTIAQELSLNIADVDSIDSPMGKFYAKMKEKGKYDAVKLAVLGVLLARGENKARQFFECVAEKDKAPIGPEKVKQLFEAMAFVSADSLPTLSLPAEEQTPIPGFTLSPAALNAYVAQLKAGKDTFVDRSANDLMQGKGKVTLEDFVSSIQSNENLRALTNPCAVRRAMKKAAPPVVAKPGSGLGKAASLFGKGFLGAKK